MGSLKASVLSIASDVSSNNGMSLAGSIFFHINPILNLIIVDNYDIFACLLINNVEEKKIPTDALCNTAHTQSVTQSCNEGYKSAPRTAP